MGRELYRHVPDLSWPRWPDVSLPLRELLSSPATTEAVLEWSRGAKLDFGGRSMGAARRACYARNMLAWLSLRGLAAYESGKWRGTGEGHLL